MTRLMGIFGTGRSGSTWLGVIVASHPEVAYRFEPFHRLGLGCPKLGRVWGLIDSASFGAEHLRDLYDALLPADPRTDKPPFFPRAYRTRCSRGRQMLWPVCRRTALLRPLYRAMYSPLDRPPLVFKEVTLERIMHGLLEHTDVPVVYLVRHPAGVVNSTMRGQRQGLMTSGRRGVLRDLLRKHDQTLAEKYAGRVDELHPTEIESLLWRIDVEQGVRAAMACPTGQVVVYEALCEDTLNVAAGVLEHFGLEMTDETRRFIELSTDGEQTGAQRRREVGIDSYFSVFRDPLVAAQRWKEQLSADDQRRVMSIVHDSEVYELGASQGGW